MGLICRISLNTNTDKLYINRKDFMEMQAKLLDALLVAEVIIAQTFMSAGFPRRVKQSILFPQLTTETTVSAYKHFFFLSNNKFWCF